MQFFVFKKNGASNIIDAESLDDAYIQAGSGIISIEEKEYARETSNKNEKDLENYYSRFFKEETSLIKKINKLISLFNNCKKINEWDKRFIYSTKRNINNNINISFSQQQKVEDLYVKYINF